MMLLLFQFNSATSTKSFRKTQFNQDFNSKPGRTNHYRLLNSTTESVTEDQQLGLGVTLLILAIVISLFVGFLFWCCLYAGSCFEIKDRGVIPRVTTRRSTPSLAPSRYRVPETENEIEMIQAVPHMNSSASIEEELRLQREVSRPPF